MNKEDALDVLKFIYGEPAAPEEKPGRVIECLACGDRIQSRHRHDMVFCSCKSVAIDGGAAYTKISGDLGLFRYLEAVPQVCTACGLEYEGCNFGWCGCNTDQENPLIK